MIRTPICISHIFFQEVRIPRNPQTLEHIKIKGLYPCGEGAGYAGGIISAAIDGQKCAEMCC